MSYESIDTGQPKEELKNKGQCKLTRAIQWEFTGVVLAGYAVVDGTQSLKTCPVHRKTGKLISGPCGVNVNAKKRVKLAYNLVHIHY